MRIISGKYKGLILKEYNVQGTRPTMDRIKESLFAMIQLNLKNAVVLDLFAGSGSLGIEAVSNGAKEAYFVDKNKICIDNLKKNTLAIKNCNLYNLDYVNALKEFKKNNIKFDIVFLDPPYDLNLINSSIELLIENNLLNLNALIICEYTKEIINTNLKIYKEKKYGDKYIKIFQYS